MRIPERHKRTIQALFEADPEVMQATCDIPHEDPEGYLWPANDLEDSMPYCGCFVGVYGWMHACKQEKKVGYGWRIPDVLADTVSISDDTIREFAGWCHTVERDEAAVRYARSLLAAT